MNDPEKAQLESANFENFLHVGARHFDRYEPQLPPEPDVIAWSEARQFGIEITNFHRQEQKQKESEEDRILEAAWRLYDSDHLPQLLVHVGWAHQFKPRRKDRQQIAQKIVALAVRHRPAPRAYVMLDWRQFDPDLIPMVDHMSLYGMPDSLKGLWSAARGGFVPQWNRVQLQSEIDRKKEKPKEYRTSYFEIWLLVVSPFGAPSSWMEVNDEIRNAKFVSPFDKVFLLSSFPFEVTELHSIRSAEA